MDEIEIDLLIKIVKSKVNVGTIRVTNNWS